MSPRPENLGAGDKSRVEKQIEGRVSALTLREQERAKEDIVAFLKSVKEIAELHQGQPIDFLGYIVDKGCVHPLIISKEWGGVSVVAGRNFSKLFGAATSGLPAQPETISGVDVYWQIRRVYVHAFYKRGKLNTIDAIDGVEVYKKHLQEEPESKRTGVVILDRIGMTPEEIVETMSALDLPRVAGGLRKAAGIIL